MDNIAAARRDRVALFKKVFLFAKLFVMLVLSVLGSIYFVWRQFYNQVNLKRTPNPTVADCLKYCEQNKFLVISSVICCVIACHTERGRKPGRELPSRCPQRPWTQPGMRGRT